MYITLESTSIECTFTGRKNMFESVHERRRNEMGACCIGVLYAWVWWIALRIFI